MEEGIEQGNSSKIDSSKPGKIFKTDNKIFLDKSDKGTGMGRGVEKDGKEEEEEQEEGDGEEEVERKRNKGTEIGQQAERQAVGYPDRMRSKREFWREILHAKKSELELLEMHTPEFIDNIPPERYHSVPRPGRGNPREREKNIKSHRAAVEFAADGIVMEVTEGEVVVAAPHYIKKEPGGKERWIWIGDHTNARIAVQSYKVETAEYVRVWIRENYYTFHLDIKKAFYHGRLDPRYRKYFGFITEDEDGRLHYWVFIGLPMGYRLSPIIFYRLMTPIMRYLRRRAIMLTLFVDDAGGQSPTLEQAEKDAKIVRETMELAGATLSEKSKWTPTQEMEHIGYIWDTRAPANITLTAKRMRKIEEGIAKIDGKAGTEITHRQAGRSAGRVMSAKLVIGNRARLLTRAAYKAATPRIEGAWDDKTKITEQMEMEIKLLKEVLAGELRIPLVEEIKKINTDLKSDASKTGVGSYLETLDGEKIGRTTAAPLPEGMEGDDASTLREMGGAVIAVRENLEDIRGRTIGLGLDNQGAVRALIIGSPVEKMQKLAIEMYLIEKEEMKGGEIKPYWTPREENEKADRASKDSDKNDYQVSKRGLEETMRKMGLQARDIIDAFGNPWDELRKLEIPYWGRYYYRGSLGEDGMSKQWGGRKETLWCFPPITMLVAVLEKIRREKVKAIVIFPMWPNRPYMPILFDEEGHSREMVKEWRIMAKGEIELGKQGRPWFLTHPIEGERSQFVAIRVDTTEMSQGRKGPALCTHKYYGGRCCKCGD